MKINILMVCLGNICRSPLAEGILKNKVDALKVFVDSAGTAGFHIGKPPDRRSIAVAKKNGIDISQQRCRKFTKEDFSNFDIIYAMDRANYKDLLALADTTRQSSKIKLLLEEVSLASADVPDPYYENDAAFESVFQLIDVACNAIATKLIQGK
ncbi:low molecular weight protein-tyrosine-phosphatase [Arenibacter sp. GZD96]|uniref:low molecular weight protein-tyrosine-phosphatase n=1 Tax=Aurantibrevibacter litoralis TaxID=3106030 RepID=UPI002AFDF76B|nr:low molecular weight protein-tyrosine-phosphatase [Arenibacter sp. GZD-96]MEA1786323.1 low molecular weight protein-tyrosine-phosphatase [Arenibacter sp. GZD-96]